jgi:hypothetical protein
MKPVALVIAMLLSVSAVRPAEACGYREPAWRAAMWTFFDKAQLPEGRLHRAHFVDEERGVAAVEIRWKPAGQAEKARLVFLRRGPKPAARFAEAEWTVAELGMAWLPAADERVVATRG